MASAGILSGCMLIMIPMIPLHKRPAFQSLFGMVFGIASVIGPPSDRCARKGSPTLEFELSSIADVDNGIDASVCASSTDSRNGVQLQPF
ncbi:hypothetical protein B0H66DRAFT_542371 [Apodospora peruviana]|uniref:Uncharacterized protein n=1 Tax=Apodospora peruviana TaxID=516989 RepID=A0AAE0IS25_9PEZI|nr:hypothetical protein B0H66DRAFT_542371 [Apodospora peruviana]